MISITLNDFIGFISGTERSKPGKVKKLMTRGEYSPEKDYWKKIRDGFKKFHKSGAFDSWDLNKLLLNVNQKKLDNYTAAVDGYKDFLNTNMPLWFEPTSNNWVRGELSISVNPEIGLVINHEPHLVKFYFKKQKIEIDKLMVIFELMNESLSPPFGTKISVLKVRTSKLFTMGFADLKYKGLLYEEVDSFVRIWKTLKAKEVPQNKN